MVRVEESSEQLLALVGGQNIQCFTILRNGAPCNLDVAAMVEDFGNLEVGEGCFHVLALHQMLDHILDALGRNRLAADLFDTAGEEVLEFEDTLRGVDILVGGDTADRGFVDVDVLCHILAV